MEIQPPLTRWTAPSTSRTLSIVSSRDRRSSTSGSSAGSESGRPACARASNVRRTCSSGGKAIEARYWQHIHACSFECVGVVLCAASSGGGSALYGEYKRQCFFGPRAA